MGEGGGVLGNHLTRVGRKTNKRRTSTGEVSGFKGGGFKKNTISNAVNQRASAETKQKINKKTTADHLKKPITAEAERAATQVSFHALTIMMIKQLPENHAAINEEAEGDPNSYADKSGATERHLVKSLA